MSKLYSTEREGYSEIGVPSFRLHYHVSLHTVAHFPSLVLLRALLSQKSSAECGPRPRRHFRAGGGQVEGGGGQRRVLVHSDALLGSGLTKEHQACTLGPLNSFRGDLGQRMLLNREGLG